MIVYRIYTWSNGVIDIKTQKDVTKWIIMNTGKFRYYRKIIVYEENE